MSLFKKLTSVILSGLMLIATLGVSNTFATTDYQVYVAVFCKDKEKGNEMVRLMCREKGTFNAVERRVFFMGEKNDTENCTVVYDESDDTNYHINFRVMTNVDTTYGSKSRNLLEKCSEAIILYDISDSELEAIVQTKDLARFENIENLLSLKTPLMKFINKLQYKRLWIFFPSWCDSIDFVSYGRDKLPSEEDYQQRKDAINRFTCTTERYYGIDNKWGRGHPDISLPNFYEYTLFGIIGSARRSIKDGSVSGKDESGHSILLPATGITLACGTVLAGGYGIYKGVKKIINKKPAVKTKSSEKVKNLV